jgi:WXG100 family type VII secretion target
VIAVANQNTINDIPGMERAKALFAATQAEATQHKQRVRGEVDSLNATWAGEAANSYLNAMTAWEGLCQDIITRLHAMEEKMATNIQQITEAGDDSTRAAGTVVNAINAGLPGV